jgi:hypothetical protein
MLHKRRQRRMYRAGCTDAAALALGTMLVSLAYSSRLAAAGDGGRRAVGMRPLWRWLPQQRQSSCDNSLILAPYTMAGCGLDSGRQ